MTGGQANERYIKMQAFEEHAEYYDDGGEWLPLSVWATRGFDVEAIALKSRPEDRRSHPIVGDTFRVSILRSGHRGNKGAKKIDIMSAASASEPGASSSSAALPPSSSMLAIGDQPAESDSSSSSSDSSSSRKRSKKSKKSKKTKKESKKESKKVKKEKKEKELKRKREVEEAKASVSSTAYVGDHR